MGDSNAQNSFRDQVFSIVRAIPAGYVLTYGQVAFLVGRPRNSRLVGKVLSGCPNDVPAHRIVNHSGRAVPRWSQQIDLLKSEGVKFRPNGNVDLNNNLWSLSEGFKI